MCFETLKLDELGVRMDEISKRMASKRLVDMRGRLMAEQSGSSPPLSVDYHETNSSSH